MSRALEKLGKWRQFFASWQVGTRPPEDGEYRAVSHHLEATIMLRAESSALIGLLIKKGVFTEEEFRTALDEEAELLSAQYAESYPGWEATEQGMAMTMPQALHTVKTLGFPP